MISYDDLVRQMRLLNDYGKGAGADETVFGKTADAITTLTARVAELGRERDDQRAWCDRLMEGDRKTRIALGERFTLVPPDGGDVKTHEGARAAIETLATLEADAVDYRARIAKLEAENRAHALAGSMAVDVNRFVTTERDTALSRLAKAREALGPFARLCDDIIKLSAETGTDPEGWAKACLWSDLERARTTLAELEKP